MKGFTDASHRRIDRVVRRVEKMPDRLGDDPGPQQVPIPVPIVRRIELAEDLTVGATVKTYLLDKSSGSYERVQNSSGVDIRINVEDALSTFKGDAGHKGYALKMPDNKNWELLQLECP